jgi:type I restriction enzyme, S subunit
LQSDDAHGFELEDLSEPLEASPLGRGYPPSIQAGIPILRELPKGWRRYRLGELVNPIERPAALVESEVYQLVTAKRNRGGIVAREQLRADQIRTKTQFTVKYGDFLISNRQISHGGCGIVPVELDGALVSNEYTALKASPILDSGFLKALSHSVYFQQTCFHSSVGVHVEKLVFRLQDWLSWPFNIPSLEEQRRIADVLDRWDQAIDSTERLITAKRRRFRALLDRYVAEHHEDRIEFGELVSLASKKAQPGNQGVPVMSIELENIESGTGRLLGAQPVTGASALRNRFLAGDTLFGKLRPYLAKFARPDFNGICSTEIWVIRALPGRLDPKLLPFLVQTPEFMAAATKQSGSRMPRADWEVVETAPIPCPAKLVAQVEAATYLHTAWTASHADLLKLERLRTQKRGLMQKLLSGEWRLDREPV